MNLFLSPHSDDEAMFGAYTLLRYRPLVIQILRCDLRTPWQVRAAESVAGAAVLGCEVEQWDFLESAPEWEPILQRLLALPWPERVWAPAPCTQGHPHHNLVGALAVLAFPHVSLYATYAYDENVGLHVKTTAGNLVPFEPEWPALKQQALDCYVSQHGNSSFQWPLEEYIA